MVPPTFAIPSVSFVKETALDFPFLERTGLPKGRKISKSPHSGMTKKVVIVALYALAIAVAIASIPLTGGCHVAIGILGGVALALFIQLIVLRSQKGRRAVEPTIGKIEGISSLKPENGVVFYRRQLKRMEEIAQAFDSRGRGVDDRILNQILKLVDRTKMYADYHQRQLQKLQERLSIELGETRASQVMKMDFVPQTGTSHKPLNDQRIDYIVSRAKNYFHNQETFVRLRTKLKEELGDLTILEKVIDPVDFKAFVEGHRLLGSATEKFILMAAGKIHKEEIFLQLLDKVKKAANLDLYLDEKHIEDKFEIGKVLSSLTPEEEQQRREDLRKIINQAFVVRELKEKGKLTTGDREETFLLECLGYNVSQEDSPYQNKQAIYEVIQHVVEKQLLQENYKGSLSVVKGVMQKTAIEARLNAAGICSTDQIERFQVAQKLLKDARNQLIDEAKKYSLKVPTSFPLNSDSLNLLALESHFEMYKQSVIEDFLKHMFGDSHLQEAFRQETEDFEQLIRKRVTAQMVKNADKLAKKFDKPILSKELHFFGKWGENLHSEMVQGFGDEQAVLGEGICFGLCQNLQIDGIKNPHLSLEELIRRNPIGGAQRFFQGLYAGALKTEGLHILPSEFAHKQGVEERGVFSIIHRSGMIKIFKESTPSLVETSPEVQKKIDISVNVIAQQYQLNDKDIVISSDGQFMEDLKKEIKTRDLSASQGWLRLSLSGAGHTIALRIDEKNQRVWLFDPNIGFFAFEKSEKSFTESRDQCLDCLKDVLDLYYPKTFGVQFTQLHLYKKLTSVATP